MTFREKLRLAWELLRGAQTFGPGMMFIPGGNRKGYRYYGIITNMDVAYHDPKERYDQSTGQVPGTHLKH